MKQRVREQREVQAGLAPHFRLLWLTALVLGSSIQPFAHVERTSFHSHMKPEIEMRQFQFIFPDKLALLTLRKWSKLGVLYLSKSGEFSLTCWGVMDEDEEFVRIG